MNKGKHLYNDNLRTLVFIYMDVMSVGSCVLHSAHVRYVWEGMNMNTEQETSARSTVPENTGTYVDLKLPLNARVPASSMTFRNRMEQKCLTSLSRESPGPD